MTKPINNGYHDTQCEVRYSILQTSALDWSIVARVEYLEQSKDFATKTRDTELIDGLVYMTDEMNQHHLDLEAWDTICEDVETWVNELFESELTDCNQCDGTGETTYNDDYMSGDQECHDEGTQPCDQCNGTGECTYQVNFENR